MESTITSGLMTVYDLSGAKIDSRELKNKNQVAFDVSNWQKGIYFLGVISNENSVFEKLIVQ
ncbi:MAG: T9SS type A sorting domain-containing protein [Bacteroidota bacterium]